VTQLRLVLFLIIPAVTLSFLAGCAGSPIQTGMRAEENKEAMVNVRPDMSIDEVTKIMGPPDKTEAYRGKNNEAILVYLYITEPRDIYNRTWNESNYTPFVFVGNRLSGWGWPNLEATAQRYEFVIKQR
jgi:uncharacterized protein DUF3192